MPSTQIFKFNPHNQVQKFAKHKNTLKSHQQTTMEQVRNMQSYLRKQFAKKEYICY